MKTLAKNIVDWCAKFIPMDNIVKIKVGYGIELLLDSILKLIGILMLAIIIGKVKEVIIFCLVFCPLRCLAGGIHMKSSFGCFFFMLILICIALIFGEYGRLNIGISYTIIGVLVLMCFMYAPRDTRKNPIKNDEVRRKKKYLSVVLCTIYGIVVTNMENEKIIALVLMTMILEIITILPIIDFINENRLMIRRVERWITLKKKL